MITREQLAASIDHTLLKAEATSGQIEELCRQAREYAFASVCINPIHVPLAAQLLASSGVKVCTVVGFPLGATFARIKGLETREVIAQGAQEVDMVINLGSLKDGNWSMVREDMAAVTAEAHQAGVIVKAILETCLLTREEKVRACRLALEAGVDFVKTSTGFAAGGATVADVALLREVVGSKAGVKASGGIRSWRDAWEMLQAGANRLGTSAGVVIMEEFLAGQTANGKRKPV